MTSEDFGIIPKLLILPSLIYNVVNNAGTNARAKIHDTNERLLAGHIMRIGVNLHGPFFLAREACQPRDDHPRI